MSIYPSPYDAATNSWIITLPVYSHLILTVVYGPNILMAGNYQNHSRGYQKTKKLETSLISDGDKPKSNFIQKTMNTGPIGAM
jgi:hypothetical protein